MFVDIPKGVELDFVLNGRGHGDLGQAMAGCQFNSGYYRPFLDDDNVKCVTLNTGRTRYDEEKKKHVPIYETVEVRELIQNGINFPVLNATLALRKDEWLQMDRTILAAARRRLRAWTDLANANTYGGFNAMNKMVLEHETISDPGEAIVDMDGLSEGRADAPLIQLEGIPLPITHSSFYFSSRRIGVSREGGMPLDTTMGEFAGRRVAETIEQTTIGTITGIRYGVTANYSNPPQVYGYTNHPDRVTKTDLTASASATGTTLLTETLAMIELLRGQNYYGPYMMYVSTAYDALLDGDFKTNSDKTIRQRLREIEDIQEVRRLDYLTGDVIILVQMTPDVARAINGMPITVIQWETKGGMQLNFKVMAIQVPQVRSDYNGNCGVCHGTTA